MLVGYAISLVFVFIVCLVNICVTRREGGGGKSTFASYAIELDNFPIAREGACPTREARPRPRGRAFTSSR